MACLSLILKCLLWICFRDAINDAVKYKDNPTDIEDQILEELDNFTMDEPSGKNSDSWFMKSRENLSNINLLKYASYNDHILLWDLIK